MSFSCSVDTEAIRLTFAPARGRFGAATGPRTLNEAERADPAMMEALAYVALLADETGAAFDRDAMSLRLPHDLAARLPAPVAQRIGLPPPSPFAFETDTAGLLGEANFTLTCRFTRGGQAIPIARQGAILTAQGQDWLLPHPILAALSVAAQLEQGAPLADHWTALAQFRRALDPEAVMPGQDFAGRMEMSRFLAALRIEVAEGFAISPGPGGQDFDPVPFGRNPDGPEGTELPSETAGVLDPATLATFQKAVRGPLAAAAAYRVGDNRYLIVDPGARPVLEVMARMLRADAETRAAFIRNPGPALDDAVRDHLRRAGRLDGLDPPVVEEEVAKAGEGRFVITREYSERVVGRGRWEPPVLPPGSGTGSDWFPEHLHPDWLARLRAWPPESAGAAANQVREAIAAGIASVVLFPGDGSPQIEVPATLEVLTILLSRVPQETGPGGTPTGKTVLITHTNIWDLDWVKQITPRDTGPEVWPDSLATEPLPHQREAFTAQVAAFRAGLPGFLNADEQGLGKTFETISFLAWLRCQPQGRDPILVVAPTSLLRNWEEEVARHMNSGGLGRLVRLWGPELARLRSGGGIDPTRFMTGPAGPPGWLLVTYQTLADHHESLAKVRFSAVVFDETQNLKNPGTLRANAARAVNAGFRIGLTGTPVENGMGELWAVMDQLLPGGLGTLRLFMAQFGTGDEEWLKGLHASLFGPAGTRPPAALRRLKAEVVPDLIPKTRRLHPRLMPAGQAESYDAACRSFAASAKGDALKRLHHIRSVSAHPDPVSDAPATEFIAASARYSAGFEVLDRVRHVRERALVFIESLDLQVRFLTLARQRYGLARIDVINGGTPIQTRQRIVERFQRHLSRDEGFDLLVLSPRAAGVGLTLTAANHVLHLSRWWNPAVEEQCNDRVHRIGQVRPVTVHLPLAIHPVSRDRSFDCLLQELMERKRSLATRALAPFGDSPADLDRFREGLETRMVPSEGDPLESALAALFARMGRPPPDMAPDRSVVV